MRTYIIAEAGVNHNGNMEFAKELINQAKKSGADCIKFQTYKTENLITKKAPKANYQLKSTNKNESQFDMLKKLELSYDNFEHLYNYSKKVGIDFISTPYNFEDIDFLDYLGIELFKVASGQLTELPFLAYLAKKNKKIILSTGMSDLGQVYHAVSKIREFSNEELFVLQCTTNYPSKIIDANLKCMKTIKSACNVEVGYSDHVIGNFACYAAVALGAKIIEKHFTLDKSLPGPDHLCSSDPSEFSQLVNGIREIEKSLGNENKFPTDSELENIKGMRRSLVARKMIKKGQIIKKKDLVFKRPLNGLDTNYYELVLGKYAAFDIEPDSPIYYNSIQW